MRKLSLIFVVLGLVAAAGAQGNTLTIQFPGVPTGGCAFIMRAINKATGDDYNCFNGAWNKVGPGGGGGGGTVTSFSSGDLSPLFTTSVLNATTTPALSFSLSNAAAYSYFGNNTGVSAAPGFSQVDYTHLLNLPTLAQTLASVTSKWLKSYDATTGLFTQTQPTPTDVSLGNVTNDAQTKAAVMPNTAPTAGQIPVGNAGNTAYAPQTISGSGATVTLSSAGVLTLSAIPNATLSNSSITVNTTAPITGGASPALGGSMTVACGTCLTANQSITVSGAVTGSGTTAIATSPGKIDVLDSSRFCADAGVSDTYACNLSPAVTAYVTGTHYGFKANTANTGVASINFNAVGAITIKKAPGGITTDLADNDIRAGQWADLIYDGTNMQMQSLLGNAPAGSGTVTSIGTTAPITGGTITATGTIACATCATTTNGGALSGTAPIAISAGGAISITSPLPLANGGTAQASALAARGSSGLNVEGATGHGDSTYSVLATDRLVYTNAAFTASRTWTLPAANAVNVGGVVCFIDLQGTVTSTNTLVIARAGSDTINGAGTTATFSVANDGGCFISDGTSKWAYNVAPTSVANGGTGAATLTGIPRASGTAAMTAAELSGDVTTSGSNATTIAAGVVTASKVDSTVKGYATANTGSNAMASAVTDTKLLEFSLSAAELNVANKVIHIHASGTWTTGTTQTPTWNFKFKLCTVSGCGSGTAITLTTWTSAAATASTTQTWIVDADCPITTTGASGTLLCHGIADLPVGTSANTAFAGFHDVNTANTSAIDLTGALFLDVMANVSTQSGTKNSCTAHTFKMTP